MANVIVDDSALHGIGEAIREKGKTEQTLLPSEMPDAIRQLNFSEDAKLIGYAEKTINLSADTTFDNLTTISDTASSTIRAAQTYELDVTFDEVIDYENCDVICLASTEIEYKFKDGAILPRGIIQRQTAFLHYGKYNRYNNYPFDDNTVLVSINVPSSSITSYYYLSTSGILSQTTSISNNGIAAGSTNPTIWTAATPMGSGGANQNSRYAYRATWSTSAITVRGSTSQFSGASMKYIDSKATNIVRKMYVYKVPKEQRGVMGDIIQKTILLEDLIEL